MFSSRASKGVGRKRHAQAVGIHSEAGRGIDVSGNKPKLLTQEMVEESDKVITMGCSIEEACPTVFVPSEDWGLEDPRGQPVEVVRRIRDQVEERVRAMIPVLPQ